MIIIDTQPQVLSNIKVDILFQDFEQKIKNVNNHSEIFKIAEKTLDKAKGTWRPEAVYQLFEFNYKGKDNFGSVIPNCGGQLKFDFGYSIKFLTHASHALIAVYTAGQELEAVSREASENGHLLESYFLDLIGLIVLEKTGNFIKEIAEKKAAELGWGLGPFLSPGSVHGWELAEQKKLCSLLPLGKINVNIREDAVLSPFKTISSFIGLGPGYKSVKVGTACQVCSKKHDCQMKHL